MSLTVAPIRLLMAGFCLLIAWPIAALALLGRDKDEEKVPLAGWRNMLRPIVVFFCRGVFFWGGLHWLSVKGKRATSQEAPIVALSPHSSYFDSVVVTYLDLTSVVAKSESEYVPIFGTLIRYTQPVFVSREDPDSRVNTIKEIKRRAQSNGKWPQIVIFPEGTCTNRSCLISFKPGAFYPGVPIQPVLIRYLNELDTVTWTWDGPGPFAVLWYTLCQFQTRMEIEFLPVYHPNTLELADPKLFANNVREEMARCLGVPVTDHTYDDCRLMQRAAINKLPMASGLVEFYKLHQKLGLDFDTIKEMFDRFCKICRGKPGRVTIEEFAKYLRLPVSDPLRTVFQLYDRAGSGYIDFREYVIGLSLVSGPAATEETIQLAFTLFDSDGKGYISEEELSQILLNAFGMNDIDTHELFKEVDADEDGKITYDEFQACAEKKPEYAKLFVTYREMSDSSKQNGHPGGEHGHDQPLNKAE
ncbi:lysophosphatidylcholine acyltransferase 1-like [Liolophura sinensis]|uniref:lysophosphatidylcholine acyltransferase 1-like n=1 Tax=Liolophura sinensis TaxID=3198878 RepID=UPI0031583B5F